MRGRNSIDWSIKNIADSIKKSQQEKFDSLIVCSGNRGLGKSTLAIKIASRFPEFNMQRDIVFSREDVMKQIATKKHGVIIADEMINVTYNRDFFVQDQNKIIKMLNMYRDSCNIFIACIPSFAALDKQFRQLVKLRLDVIERGMAVVHMPNMKSYSADVWDMGVNEKIEANWMKNDVTRPKYDRLSTYEGYLVSGDLGVKQREAYEQIKNEKRGHLVEEDVGDEENTKQRKWREILVDIALEGKLNKDLFRSMCEMNKMTYESGLIVCNRELAIRKSDSKIGSLLTNNIKAVLITHNDTRTENPEILIAST